MYMKVFRLSTIFLLFIYICQCISGNVYSFKKYKYGGDGYPINEKYESKEVIKEVFKKPIDGSFSIPNCIYSVSGCIDKKKTYGEKNLKKNALFQNIGYHKFGTFDLKNVCLRKTGLVPNKLDCCSFISCSNGIAHILKCGPGTIFNSLKLVCDYPHQAKCIATNPDCAYKKIAYNLKKSQW